MSQIDDRKLEARLQRDEEALTFSAWRAHDPAKDCLAFSELRRLGNAERDPSNAELGHLDDCRMCRMAVIVSACQRPVQGHKLLGEDAWKEQRSRLTSWSNFVARTRELELRSNAGRPWWKGWAGIGAAAAILMITLSIARLLLSPFQDPLSGASINWYLANAEGLPLGPDRSADSLSVSEFKIHIQMDRPGHLRLFIYGPDGSRRVMEPQEGQESMLLDADLVELGPYDVDPLERRDIVLLVASKPIPTGRAEGILPAQLNSKQGERRTKELDQAVQSVQTVLGCFADRRTFIPAGQ